MSNNIEHPIKPLVDETCLADLWDVWQGGHVTMADMVDESTLDAPDVALDAFLDALAQS